MFYRTGGRRFFRVLFFAYVFRGSSEQAFSFFLRFWVPEGGTFLEPFLHFYRFLVKMRTLHFCTPLHRVGLISMVWDVPGCKKRVKLGFWKNIVF